MENVSTAAFGGRLGMTNLALSSYNLALATAIARRMNLHQGKACSRSAVRSISSGYRPSFNFDVTRLSKEPQNLRMPLTTMRLATSTPISRFGRASSLIIITSISDSPPYWEYALPLADLPSPHKTRGFQKATLVITSSWICWVVANTGGLARTTKLNCIIIRVTGMRLVIDPRTSTLAIKTSFGWSRRRE